MQCNAWLCLSWGIHSVYRGWIRCNSLRDFDQANSSGISLVDNRRFSGFLVFENEKVVVDVIQREHGFVDGHGSVEIIAVYLQYVGLVDIDKVIFGVRDVGGDVLVLVGGLVELHFLQHFHQVLPHAVPCVVSLVSAASVFLELGLQGLGDRVDGFVHIGGFFLAVDGETLEGSGAIHSVTILDRWIFADRKMDVTLPHETSAAEFVEQTTDSLLCVILEGLSQFDVVAGEHQFAGFDRVGHKDSCRRRISCRGLGGKDREGGCRQRSQQQ
mmetsp:Transcript_451/g.1142  ORF Transcript_451/g.1142 Transcript_451/m.1142 type:complete len:271 (-) Transcript_451:120-932(-)